MKVKLCFVIFNFLFSGFVAFAQTPNKLVVDEIEENFYQAITQHAIENYDKAITLLKRNIHLDPENAVFYNQLGKNYFALQDYYQSELAYQKAVSLDPEQKWFWTDLYTLFYATQNHEKALPIAMKLAEIDDKYAYDLLSLYVYVKQYDKALNLLADIEQKEKLSKGLEELKLQIKEEMQFNDKLDSYFNNVAPTDENAYTELISHYLKAEDYDNVYKTIEKLVKNVPDSKWMNVVNFYLTLQANKHDETFSNLIAVIQNTEIHQPIKYRIFNEYIIFVNSDPKYESDLEKAVDAFKNQDLINMPKEVGRFFLSKNKHQLACFYFEKGLQIDANDIDLIMLFIKSNFLNKQYNEAEKIATKYIERFPTEPYLYYALGYAQLHLNQPKKAIKSFTKH